MNSNQPQITASLDANGAATISIQLSPKVKIELAVTNGGFVIGKVIDSSPPIAVLDDAKYKKMLADEQREYDAQMQAARDLRQRRALGLE